MFDLFRPDWGAAPPARSYVTIAWTARPGVETHHSVGLYGTTRAGSWMKTMQRDHLSRGWTDVFYNVGIYTDGVIVEGRPASAQSGPIKDLTVCFAGDYRTRGLTDTQKQSWHKVRNHALAQGVGTRIVWHALRGGSSCPGTNVINWLKTLNEEEHDMASPGQKLMVDLAYNLFPEEMGGKASFWHNLDENDSQWDTHFRPALSKGAQNLYKRSKSGVGAHDHDGRYIKNVIVSK